MWVHPSTVRPLEDRKLHWGCLSSLYMCWARARGAVLIASYRWLMRSQQSTDAGAGAAGAHPDASAGEPGAIPASRGFRADRARASADGSAEQPRAFAADCRAGDTFVGPHTGTVSRTHPGAEPGSGTDTNSARRPGADAYASAGGDSGSGRCTSHHAAKPDDGRPGPHAGHAGAGRGRCGADARACADASGSADAESSTCACADPHAGALRRTSCPSAPFTSRPLLPSPPPLAHPSHQLLLPHRPPPAERRKLLAKGGACRVPCC